MQLPEGLTSRPLRADDAAAVYSVMAAQQLHDLGTVEIEEADIVADWQRPSYDVGASTMGVYDDDRLVAYGEVIDAWRGDASVHPDYLGRGIGTALACWMQEHARGRGSQIIGMPVPQGSAGDRLLADLGYFVRWTSWVLALPDGGEITAQPLPEGYQIRSALTEDEQCAVWTVKEDAFLEWSEREREPFGDFLATSVRRPGFQPWNLRLVADAAGDVVGSCLVLLAGDVAYVDQIAVRKDQRGLGLARSLLVDAFGNAREHGAVRSELSTDSRTGALGLYEKVGMVVTSTWLHRAIRL